MIKLCEWFLPINQAEISRRHVFILAAGAGLHVNTLALDSSGLNPQTRPDDMSLCTPHPMNLSLIHI